LGHAGGIQRSDAVNQAGGHGQLGHAGMPDQLDCG